MNWNPYVLSLVAVFLAACQKGADPAQLTRSAEIFLKEGGLSVLSRSGAVGTRPCLRNLSTVPATLGGVFGTSERLVDFVEAHKLATVKREQTASGTRTVAITPVPPYEANWLGQGTIKSFCIGTVVLVRVEAVADAQPITAGAAEPYIIPGTPARVTRLTYRLDDVPEGTFVDDLKAQPNLLVPGSMSPETFGKELTAIATLPVKPENYAFTP